MVSSRDLLLIYRKLYSAFGPQGWWPTISKNKSFEIAVGAVLTQNTTWRNAEKALLNLNRAGLINAYKLSKCDKAKLARLIRSSGYYNQKAERLKLLARFYAANKKPRREELLSLKGIGFETADSIMLYAYDEPYFIADAYSRRIFSRLFGIDMEKSGYEEIQNFFCSTVKMDAAVLKEFHALLVLLAKKHCRKRPLCKGCPLASICSFCQIKKRKF